MKNRVLYTDRPGLGDNPVKYRRPIQDSSALVRSHFPLCETTSAEPPLTPRRATQTRKLAFVPGLASRPATPALGLAAALLGLLAVVAVVFAALQIAATNSNRPVVGIGTGLLLAGYGALLFATASGVWRGRRWSRGPAVAVSLIQLPVASSFAGGQTWWVAVVLAAVSVAVLVCLLLRSSTVVFVPPTTDQAAPDHPGPP